MGRRSRVVIQAPAGPLLISIGQPTQQSKGLCTVVAVRKDSALHGKVLVGDWIAALGDHEVRSWTLDAVMSWFIDNIEKSDRTITLLRFTSYRDMLPNAAHANQKAQEQQQLSDASLNNGAALGPASASASMQLQMLLPRYPPKPSWEDNQLQPDDAASRPPPPQQHQHQQQIGIVGENAAEDAFNWTGGLPSLADFTRALTGSSSSYPDARESRESAQTQQAERTAVTQRYEANEVSDPVAVAPDLSGASTVMSSSVPSEGVRASARKDDRDDQVTDICVIKSPLVSADENIELITFRKTSRSETNRIPFTTWPERDDGTGISVSLPASLYLRDFSTSMNGGDVLDGSIDKDKLESILLARCVHCRPNARGGTIYPYSYCIIQSLHGFLGALTTLSVHLNRCASAAQCKKSLHMAWPTRNAGKISLPEFISMFCRIYSLTFDGNHYVFEEKRDPMLTKQHLPGMSLTSYYRSAGRLRPANTNEYDSTSQELNVELNEYMDDSLQSAVSKGLDANWYALLRYNSLLWNTKSRTPVSDLSPHNLLITLTTESPPISRFVSNLFENLEILLMNLCFRRNGVSMSDDGTEQGTESLSCNGVKTSVEVTSLEGPRVVVWCKHCHGAALSGSSRSVLHSNQNQAEDAPKNHSATPTPEDYNNSDSSVCFDPWSTAKDYNATVANRIHLMGYNHLDDCSLAPISFATQLRAVRPEKDSSKFVEDGKVIFNHYLRLVERIKVGMTGGLGRDVLKETSTLCKDLELTNPRLIRTYKSLESQLRLQATTAGMDSMQEQVHVNGNFNTTILTADEVRVNDVFCNRNEMMGDHVGNRRFRALVAKNRQFFRRVGEHDKASIIRAIAAKIKKLGGRFLGTVDGGVKKRWFVLDDSLIEKVTYRILREGFVPARPPEYEHNGGPGSAVFDLEQASDIGKQHDVDMGADGETSSEKQSDDHLVHQIIESKEVTGTNIRESSMVPDLESATLPEPQGSSEMAMTT